MIFRPGALGAEIVIEADDAVDLGARKIQRSRDRGHGLGRDVTDALIHRVQHRHQRAGLVGKARDDFVDHARVKAGVAISGIGIAATIDRYTTIDAGDLDPRGCILQPDNCATAEVQMIRKFKFEDEMHESLQCVPMAVRRKLDRVGLKIGLEQWKSLDRGERLAICHLPVDSAEECDGLSVFIREAMQRRFGVEPKV